MSWQVALIEGVVFGWAGLKQAKSKSWKHKLALAGMYAIGGVLAYYMICKIVIGV